MTPTSKLINFTISELDLDLEFVDTRIDLFWGVFGIEVTNLSIKNISLFLSFLDDYNITAAVFSIDDFNVEMSSSRIKNLINEKFKALALD